MPLFDKRRAVCTIAENLQHEDARALRDSADNQLTLGDVLKKTYEARRIPTDLIPVVGDLVANLPQWHSHQPRDALELIVATASGISLCYGVLSAATAAVNKKMNVDAQAVAVTRAITPVLADSLVNTELRTCALRALAAMARAAPRALLPLWSNFMGFVLRCINDKLRVVRAAAADTAAALLLGGAPLSARKKTPLTKSIAFTSTAETVHRNCVEACRVIAIALLNENDRGVVIRLLKAANVVASLTLPSDTCEHLVDALLFRADNIDSEPSVRAGAIAAIANALNPRNASILQDNVVLVVLDFVVNSLNISHQPVIEETLLILQALCTSCVQLVWTKWELLQHSITRLSVGDRDVIALHAVRAVEKLLSASLSFHMEQNEQIVEVYMKISWPAHRHGFHAVRNAATLSAEHILRFVDRESRYPLARDARDALLYTALNDNALLVRCVAVRALAAVMFIEDNIEDAVQIITTVHELLVRENTPKVLQSRCAWTLAALVRNAFDVFNILDHGLLECFLACEQYAVVALNRRIDSLVSGDSSIRSSDADTCATGFVRLLAALLRRPLSFASQSSINCLCTVVRCTAEAPKTRWNACTALGDVLLSSHDDNVIAALHFACSSADTVKIRTAAARALRPAACVLGVTETMGLFDAARQLMGAPRDVIEACAVATAALVHDALANANCNDVSLFGDPQLLVDAVALHTQLPSYVLNPRAKLPPGVSHADTPVAAIAALPTLSHAALSTVVLVADTRPQFKPLADHLRAVLDVKNTQDLCG